MMKNGTGFKNVSDPYMASELCQKYNLAVCYDENEDCFFGCDYNESDIFEAILKVNGIKFKRFTDPLFA